jgi:hypothetical protein
MIGFAGKVAIIVVLLLLIIWIMHSAYKTGYMPEGAFRDTYESMVVGATRQYDKFFTSPVNMYAKTTGYDNDAAAQMAITKALRLEEAHEKADLSRTASSAATNAFILGDLYRYNVAPGEEDDNARKDALDTADKFYRRALRRVVQYTPEILETATPTEPIPEIMLERIADFYETNPEQQRQIEATIQNARLQVRDTRTHQSKKQGKFGRVASYYKAQPIRNDPQNTHDGVVTNDERVRFETIKRLNQEELLGTNYEEPTIRDIEKALNQLTDSWPQAKRERAREVLHTMAAASTLPVSSVGATESQILLEVWKRINSASNKDNRPDLINSLFDSLANGMEIRYDGSYSKVCSTGRCHLALDSLVLLDKSEKVAAPTKTTEVLRNEIMAKAHSIFQAELAKAPEPVKAAYNDFSETEDETLREFKQSTKKLIENTIREDYKDTKSSTLNNFIKDAQAGVDI